MKLYFKSTGLEKACNNRKEAVRKWGPGNAKKILQRLQELHNAECLDHIFRIPMAKCHALKGDRRGQYAVSAKHPYRLIFIPCNEPLTLNVDGTIDLTKVTEVIIIEVVDYHG